MSEWKVSHTFSGTAVRYRELDASGRHKVSGGLHWVETIHPYDLANYHYAYSFDGDNWIICRDVNRSRSWIDKLTGSAFEVLARLRELDKSVPSHIDHS